MHGIFGKVRGWLAAGALVAGAATASAQLQNAGFEDVCGVADGWDTFGNVSSIDFFTVSGVKAVKMFGPFCCTEGYSGIQQSRAATPGQQWKAGGWITNPSWDAFAPDGTVAYVAVDFLNADKSVTFPGAISPIIDAPVEPAVFIQTPYATAPANTAWVRISLVVKQLNFHGGAGWWDDATLSEISLGEVSLVNPSFENRPAGCTSSSTPYWENFGNGQHNLNENTRTGNYAAKLFGGYNGDPAYSGWFQNVPATGGSRWKASGYGNSLATDLIQDGNEVRLQVEFYDEFGGGLGNTAISSNMPTAAGNSLVYDYYETPVAVAPEGTAFARCVILQVQHGFAGGATWWDDMALTQVCPADFNGDGFVTGDDFDAYVLAFELGDAPADFNADGFVTGDDFDAYVLAFEAGC